MIQAISASLGEDTAGSPRPRRVRSSVDVLRLAAGAVLIGVGVALAPVLDDSFTDLSSVGSDTADRLPDWAAGTPGAVLEVAMVAAVAVIALGSIVTTRYRRLATIILAATVAAIISIAVGELIDTLIDPPARAAFDDHRRSAIPPGSWRAGPGDPLFASAVATVLVAGSFAPRELTRWLGRLVAAYVGVRVLVFGLPAVDVVSDFGSGLLAASSVLLLFGRHDLSPTPTEVAAGLGAIGIEVSGMRRRPGDGRCDTYAAVTADGATLSVDVFGPNERSADLLRRGLRSIGLRWTGDRRPFASLRRAVEHEAMVSLHVAALGVRTPRLAGVTDAGPDGLAIAYEAVVGGRPVAEGDRLDDDIAAEIWSTIRTLQDHRIAHRDLRRRNLIVDAAGAVWLTGFGRAEVAATDDLLDRDRAELLAMMASLVGNDAAISAALDVFGDDALAAALPWLQPLALNTATRTDIGGDDGIAELRTPLAERCGATDADPVPLERITTTNLFLLVTIGLSVLVLVPQLADIDDVWSQIRSASLGWAVVAVGFSALSYVAATTSLLGAMPVRLRFAPALLAQIASSFANRITPAKVGGFATNVRYFQRQGVPVAAGIAAVGVNTIAGVVIHVALTAGFLLIATSADTATGLTMPSAGMLLAGVGIVLGLAVALAAVPAARRLVTRTVVPQIRAGWTSIRTIGRSPRRLAMLFGGSAVITLSYLGAMVASLEAFGSSASFPVVALLFLTGTAVSNAAPTPGGLGATEAALVTALSTVEAVTIVVPAVFLFRFVTFWLPILPGWLALNHLRRADLL